MTETNLPEIIYHYTSYESFYNIFSTGKLHLGSPWNTNDPMEGEYHHRGLSKEKKQRYFASFSKKFDSRLIWDAYGGLGTGVAIGFKTDKLRKVIAEEKKYWESFIQKNKLKISKSKPVILILPSANLKEGCSTILANY
ncbi:MAG: DUF2971 domain-containing protein [Candidatus Caenarcaniphilales bacterium]|nr:DUF2971 domain-containing protein [Candidatus Caenarcaniphilales bacterium]